MLIKVLLENSRRIVTTRISRHVRFDIRDVLEYLIKGLEASAFKHDAYSRIDEGRSVAGVYPKMVEEVSDNRRIFCGLKGPDGIPRSHIPNNS